MHANFPAIRRSSTAALAIAMVAVLFGSRPAIGDDADPDARLQKLTVELKEHEVADKSNAATADRGKAEALRDKARTLMKKRKDRDELARTLDELEATNALIGARIEHARSQAELDAQKQKMESIKSQLASVQASADKLEKEQAALEAKLGGGK